MLASCEVRPQIIRDRQVANARFCLGRFDDWDVPIVEFDCLCDVDHIGDQIHITPSQGQHLAAPHASEKRQNNEELLLFIQIMDPLDLRRPAAGSAAIHQRIERRAGWCGQHFDRRAQRHIAVRHLGEDAFIGVDVEEEMAGVPPVFKAWRKARTPLLGSIIEKA